MKIKRGLSPGAIEGAIQKSWMGVSRGKERSSREVVLVSPRAGDGRLLRRTGVCRGQLTGTGRREFPDVVVNGDGHWQHIAQRLVSVADLGTTIFIYLRSTRNSDNDATIFTPK